MVWPTKTKNIYSKKTMQIMKHVITDKFNKYEFQEVYFSNALKSKALKFHYLKEVLNDYFKCDYFLNHTRVK